MCTYNIRITIFITAMQQVIITHETTKHNYTILGILIY